MADEITRFVQLTKVDAKLGQVWGIMSSETPDESGEIMDYEHSKPNFMKWSEKIEKASGGKSKGNKHLFRVVKIADHLAKKMKADARIVQAGAWLHDTALPSGNDYDYKKNKRIVQKILSSAPISKGDKNLIAECVASHEGTEGPKTLEARVVHDADVLEKVGLLGLIRHTWKLTNSDKINPSAVKDGDVKKIVDHIAWWNDRCCGYFAWRNRCFDFSKMCWK